MTSSGHTNSSDFSGPLQSLFTRLDPIYDEHQAFIWYGGWPLYHKSMVQESMRGAIDIFFNARELLINVGETDPSFQRYFSNSKENGSKTKTSDIIVWDLLLAYLGTPGTEDIRRCRLSDVSSLQLIYGDQPGIPGPCTPHVYAEQAGYYDVHSQATFHVKFCPDFFNNWRAHRALPHDPSAPHMALRAYVSFIDAQIPGGDGFAWSFNGAGLLIHGKQDHLIF